MKPTIEECLQAYQQGKTIVCFTHKHTYLFNRCAGHEGMLKALHSEALQVRVI